MFLSFYRQYEKQQKAGKSREPQKQRSIHKAERREAEKPTKSRKAEKQRCKEAEKQKRKEAEKQRSREAKKQKSRQAGRKAGNSRKAEKQRSKEAGKSREAGNPCGILWHSRFHTPGGADLMYITATVCISFSFSLSTLACKQARTNMCSP